MPNPESSGQTEQKVKEIREALAKAATGPWRWSRSYELHDADGVLRKHWALHNDVSDAKGLVIDWALVLHTYAATDFGGRPLEETPNLSLVAHAPEYLTFLLERLDALQRDAERWRHFADHMASVGVNEDGDPGIGCDCGDFDDLRKSHPALAAKLREDGYDSDPAAIESLVDFSIAESRKAAAVSVLSGAETT